METSYFLGHFSNGCKIVPPLPCRVSTNNTSTNNTSNKNTMNNTKNTNNANNANYLTGYISKLYYDVEALRDEWGSYRTLYKDEDTNRQYSTEVVKPCFVDIAKTSSKSLDMLTRCQFIRTHHINDNVNYPLRQVQIKFGANLLVLYAKEALFWAYFVHLKSLFEALVFMEVQNIIHPNLTPLNLVYDPNKRRFLLSEFMDARTTRTFYKDKEIPHPRAHPDFYTYYTPPEVTYAAYVLNDDNPDKKMMFNPHFEQHFRNIRKNFMSYLSASSDKTAMFENWSSNLARLRASDIEDLITGMRENARSVGDFKLFVRRNLENLSARTNVYSLGACLLECLNVSLEEVKRRHKDNIQWNLTSQHHYSKVLQIIQRMMRANPYERLTPQEALYQYNDIVNEIKRTITNTNLNDRLSEITSNTLFVLHEDVNYTEMRSLLNNKNKDAKESQGSLLGARNLFAGMMKSVGHHLSSQGPRYAAGAVGRYMTNKMKSEGNPLKRFFTFGRQRSNP